MESKFGNDTSILIILLLILIFYGIEKTMENNQLEDNKSVRSLVKAKLWLGIIQLTVISIAIIFCSWNSFIDKSVTGTLLAGIYGYSLRGVFEKV